MLVLPGLFKDRPEPDPKSVTEQPQLELDFHINLGTGSTQQLGRIHFLYIPGQTHYSSARLQQSTFDTSIMDNHKKDEELSSNLRSGAANPSHEPGAIRQTESSMPSVSETDCPNYRYTQSSRIVQWLAQVELARKGRHSPSNPSSTTPASQPPQNNIQPVTTSTAPVQQATTAPAATPPTQQFVYKWVRRGAMLGIGGSGGWVPASYVRIRVPVATTATAVASEPSQPQSSSTPRDDIECPRAQDQSSLPVAPPNSEADA